MRVRKDDLRMLAEETVRVSGGEQGYVAGTRNLQAEDILGIFEEVYSDK